MPSPMPINNAVEVVVPDGVDLDLQRAQAACERVQKKRMDFAEFLSKHPDLLGRQAVNMLHTGGIYGGRNKIKILEIKFSDQMLLVQDVADDGAAGLEYLIAYGDVDV